MASIKKDKQTKRYYYRISYKDVDGKYKTKTKKGFRTKKEAELAAKEEELRIKNEGITDPSEIVLADFYDEYVETYKIGNVSIGTERKYEYTGKLLREYFGDKKLVDLTRIEYQQFLNHRGKSVGKDALTKTHYYVKSCIELAIADGLININPTYNAQMNYQNKTDHRLKYWSEDDASKLQQYLLDFQSPANFMLYICLTTGLRIGEVYGLKYEDITEETIQVNRGYDYRILMKVTDGKNKSSIRTITNHKQLWIWLQKHKIRSQKNNSEFLFLDKFSNPIISHSGLLKHLRRICRELDIDVLTIHALRHTHCSILLYNDVSIHYIAKRLGHSSAVETTKTYSHIIDEMKQQQDEAISSIIENMENTL